jgi:hypothetical protein
MTVHRGDIARTPGHLSWWALPSWALPAAVFGLLMLAALR